MLIRRVDLERIRDMPLDLDLGAIDVRIADVVLARARRLLTRRSPETHRRRQLDVLVVVREHRGVEPDVAAERALEAELEAIERLRVERVELAREERPRIVAAGLVTRRDLSVDHRRVADVVSERDAIIRVVALIGNGQQIQAEHAAVGRVPRLPEAGRRARLGRRQVGISAAERVALLVLGLAHTEREVEAIGQMQFARWRRWPGSSRARGRARG